MRGLANLANIQIDLDIVAMWTNICWIWSIPWLKQKANLIKTHNSPAIMKITQIICIMIMSKLNKNQINHSPQNVILITLT